MSSGRGTQATPDARWRRGLTRRDSLAGSTRRDLDPAPCFSPNYRYRTRCHLQGRVTHFAAGTSSDSELAGLLPSQGPMPAACRVRQPEPRARPDSEAAARPVVSAALASRRDPAPTRSPTRSRHSSAAAAGSRCGQPRHARLNNRQLEHATPVPYLIFKLCRPLVNGHPAAARESPPAAITSRRA